MASSPGTRSMYFGSCSKNSPRAGRGIESVAGMASPRIGDGLDQGQDSSAILVVPGAGCSENARDGNLAHRRSHGSLAGDARPRRGLRAQGPAPARAGRDLLLVRPADLVLSAAAPMVPRER